MLDFSMDLSVCFITDDIPFQPSQRCSVTESQLRRSRKRN